MNNRLTPAHQWWWLFFQVCFSHCCFLIRSLYLNHLAWVFFSFKDPDWYKLYIEFEHICVFKKSLRVWKIRKSTRTYSENISPHRSHTGCLEKTDVQETASLNLYYVDALKESLGDIRFSPVLVLLLLFIRFPKKLMKSGHIFWCPKVVKKQRIHTFSGNWHLPERWLVGLSSPVHSFSCEWNAFLHKSQAWPGRHSSGLRNSICCP